jgi:protein phosphatase PTC1
MAAVGEPLLSLQVAERSESEEPEFSVSSSTEASHMAESSESVEPAVDSAGVTASGLSPEELAKLAPPMPIIPAMKPPGSPYSSVATISFAEDMNPRFRSTMEDAHAIVDEFGGDPGTGYFGIYDGHGGRNVAEYLRLHLHNNVEKELKRKGDRSIEECMKAAFLYTDIECSDTGEQASGSTAAVCIIRKQALKRYVYTANVGDARAVLCHAGVAVRLSHDHKATDACEMARVEAAGGFVIRKRVMGVLAVGRSFGDYVLKKFVPAEPYTSTTKLDGMVSFSIHPGQRRINFDM